MTERDWKARILPEYPEMRRTLQEKFDNSPVQRKDTQREARGSNHFVYTLDLAVRRTHDVDAVRSIHEALEEIVERPYAGSIAWEMRRFIGHAPPQFIAEFGRLFKELAAVCPPTANPYALSSNDFYTRIDEADPDYMNTIAQDHLNLMKGNLRIITFGKRRT